MNDSNSPGGGGSQQRFVREAPPLPEAYTSSLFNTSFDKKGTPFVNLRLKNSAPFSYLQKIRLLFIICSVK